MMEGLLAVALVIVAVFLLVALGIFIYDRWLSHWLNSIGMGARIAKVQTQLNSPLPWELRDAQLSATEMYLTHDVQISDSEWVEVRARPHKVYLLPDGHYFPAQIRTRIDGEVRQSDLDQLSMYNWIMRRNGLATLNRGLIEFPGRGYFGTRSSLVSLKDDEQCLNMVKRYAALTSGQATAAKANDHRCRTCKHLRVCSPKGRWARRPRRWSKPLFR